VPDRLVIPVQSSRALEAVDAPRAGC